jgi:hypothetical protein
MNWWTVIVFAVIFGIICVMIAQKKTLPTGQAFAIGAIRSATAILPKGTSLNTDTPDHLRAVEYEINNRPRHVLGDRSPAELFTALLTSRDHQLLRR